MGGRQIHFINFINCINFINATIFISSISSMQLYSFHQFHQCNYFHFINFINFINATIFISSISSIFKFISSIASMQLSKTRAVQSNLSGWLDPDRALGTVRSNPEQNSKKFTLFTSYNFTRVNNVNFFEFCSGFGLTVPRARPGSNHPLRLL